MKKEKIMLVEIDPEEEGHPLSIEATVVRRAGYVVWVQHSTARGKKVLGWGTWTMPVHIHTGLPLSKEWAWRVDEGSLKLLRESTPDVPV